MRAGLGDVVAVARLEMPLTVRQQLYLLAHLAFYCGVGYKTPMGMGRVRLI